MDNTASPFNETAGSSVREKRLNLLVRVERAVLPWDEVCIRGERATVASFVVSRPRFV